MAVIELSAAFATNFASRVARNTGFSGQSTGPTTSDGAKIYASSCSLLQSSNGASEYGQTYLHIMKGAVPTDFSGLSTLSTRSADILVRFAMSEMTAGFALQDFSPSNFAGNPFTVETNYVNALASGTATWFWWVIVGYQASPTTKLIANQIIGTVGTISSGSDLEIPDVSVIAGNPYRVTNLVLQFPTSWTY